MYLYKVPIIQSDLRHEETILQTANVFEYLDRIICEIFDRIDGRIDNNNARIENINRRIDTTNNKIDRLTGINKAVKIFAPAKYPATNRLIDPPATFSRSNRMKIESDKNYHVESRFDPISQRNVDDKLQFYHVASYFDVSDTNRSQLKFQIPPYMSSIDSILLFDESINVYSAKEFDRYRRQREEKNETTYSDDLQKMKQLPPMATLNRKTIDRKTTDDIFYSPGLIEAPKIDVPHDLPDLSGIADDIEYNSENEIVMQPSESIIDIVDLPVIPLDEHVVESIEEKNVSELSRTSTASFYSKIEPTSLKAIAEPKHSAEKISYSSNVLTNAPPPPPPPMPPLIQSNRHENNHPEIVKSTPLPQPKFQEENMHSNLMAAIRNAGGIGIAKLRAAKPKANNQVQNTNRGKICRWI